MGVLSDILQYKEHQDAIAQNNAASIGRAFDTFNQMRQQGISNKLADLQVRGNLGAQGIGVGADGSLRRDNSLLNPLQMITQASQLQANAMTSGNTQLYGMAGSAINSLMGGGQQQGGGMPIQPPSMLDQFIQGTGEQAKAASVVAQVHNSINEAKDQQQQAQDGSGGAIVSGGSINPISGAISQNFTVPAAKAAENAAGAMGSAKADAAIGQARDNSQLSMVTQGIKNMNEIHKELSDKGWAGDIYKAAILANIDKIPTDVFGIHPQKAIPEDVQKLAGKFTSARNETLVKVQPILSQQFGAQGSTRIMDSLINLSKGEFGDLSTPHAQFEGQAEGTIGSLYRIKLASDKYFDELKQAGQPIPSNEKSVVNGIYSKMGDLTDAQNTNLKSMVNNVLGKNQQTTDFKTEQDAVKANLPKGTIVIINGRRARVD